MTGKISFILIFITFLFHPPLFYAQDSTIIFRWNNIDNLIRDNRIKKDAAIDSLKLFVKLTVKYCELNNIKFTKHNDWVFPMSGLTICSYRDNGKDYKDSRFDFFQGAEFNDHPAHDIFILDSDSNSIEDSTKKHVNAVAMTSGVIISIYNTWEKGNFLRSGKYIKLFDPESESIFYYSHLDSVFVKPGDIIIAGDIIGLVGRTGRNAISGRTHLHIAYYKIEDGYPKPKNILKDLYRTEKKYFGKRN